MNNEISTTETRDFLSEADILRQDASTTQRFLNFLIDNLFMRFGLSYATGLLIGMLLQTFFPDFTSNMPTSNGFEYSFVILLIGYVNYVVYYTFCEKIFQGYTLGKLVTGTKAIREDGQPLTFKDALLRSLSRIVPFEAFSGFGRPWHDSWTNTKVIKLR